MNCFYCNNNAEIEQSSNLLREVHSSILKHYSSFRKREDTVGSTEICAADGR